MAQGKMAQGKKVKINFKNSKKTMTDEQKAESLELSPKSDLNDNLEVAGEQTDKAEKGSAFEDQRLKEFLERDADFLGLESQDQPESSDDEVGKLKQELAAANDRYLRAIADLENFRKNSLKEKSDLLKYQGERLVVDLLEVIDNFDLAIQHKDAELESLRTGVSMIHKQLMDVLERWGVKPESSLGQPFDPNKHNAINKIVSPDAEPGSIVAELKKPYFYKDKLIRVGNVVVAQAQDPENNES